MALYFLRRGRRDASILAWWEPIRDGGRRRYIIVYGVLRFGVAVGVTGDLINHWIGAPGPLWRKLGISLMLAPLSGYWFGAMTWSMNERTYQERTAGRVSEPERGISRAGQASE